MNDADALRRIITAIIKDRGRLEAATLGLAVAHVLARSLHTPAECARVDALAAELADVMMATGPDDSDDPLDVVFARARRLDDRGGRVVDFGNARMARGLADSEVQS